MKRRTGLFFVVLVGLSVLFFSGCKLPGVPVGTVIVNLTGAGAAPAGDYLYAYIYAEGEEDTDEAYPENVLATMKVEIISGSATSLLYVDDGAFGPTGTVWSGTDGTTYDIYIYTSDNSNSPEDYTPSKKEEPFPGTVTINGNQIITVDYGEMAPYTDPVT